MRYREKIDNLSKKDFYEKIKKPADDSYFLPLCARVWLDGLEYSINGINYFIPTNENCVYKILTLKDIRNSKLKKIYDK